VVFAEDILPIAGSANVSDYLYHGIEKDLGGRWAIESDPVQAAEMILAHIESKRDALGINKTKERKLYDMADRRALAVE
jgi:carbon-monoxide dehydrogenase catalytic subunit